MKEIKRMVTEAPILAFYDPARELVIECDASQKGLGAVLMQQGRSIAYASRALTPTETRYAQIGEETPSVVFSLDKFNQYVFARKTTIFNDHKQIEALMKKPMHRAPIRLQCMFLKIHGYDVNIVYRKRKEMYIHSVSDMLSRAYLPDTGNQGEIEHVNMVQYLPIRPERLQQLKTETESDEALQLLKTWMARREARTADSHNALKQHQR